MCGILLAKEELFNFDRLDSIKHRGIESNFKKSQGWVLCHHRLPIQTLDGDKWSQPLLLNDNKYILFNGEIFNYPKGYSSDSEYLQSIFKNANIESSSIFYSIFGSTINQWDGFWAIVIVDLNRDRILAFTDPLGKKQLYYNESGEICSEVKGLVNSNSEINYNYISNIKKFGYNHDDETSYKGIKRIVPNRIYSWYTHYPKGIEILFNYNSTYYSIDPDINRMSYKERQELLIKYLRESVKARLISQKHPISVLLSGGLDSTIITALLQEIGADVTYFTIENGEDDYIRDCEEYWGINVKRLKYSMEFDTANSDKIKEIYQKWNESPIDLGSVIPQYWLFKAVKDKTGHRIVISGDGADELFGGYKRINEYDSQMSDIFTELTYYHLPRLDRMSMAHTIELRTPFLSSDMLKLAISLPFEERKNKKILKDAFTGKIPQSIIDRDKKALKNDKIVTNPLEYRDSAINFFLGYSDIYFKS